MLKGRDYTLIIDRSGSMVEHDCHGKTRWAAAQEGTLALAAKIDELDPDGITVYTFAGKFKRYDNVTADKVKDLFAENEPNGSTDLAGVLSDVFADFFKRRAKGETKSEGDVVLVVTDGEPDDQQAVVDVIIGATKKLDNENEISLELIQIGQCPGATKFLKFLDDGLQAKGAKFDIVDTTTAEDSGNMTFTELLTKAIAHHG